MRRLVKYAAVLALAVAIGAYIVLGPANVDDLFSDGEQEAAISQPEPTPTAPSASNDEEQDYIVAERRASLEGWSVFLAAHPSGAYAHVATAKVEQLLLDMRDSAPGHAAVSNDAPPDARAVSGLRNPVAPAAGDAVPPAAVSNDAPAEAKPTREAARPVTPTVATDVAAGTQGAALAPDEICRRDGERLEQLRSHPSGDELVHFANQLACTTLLPQVVSLMKNLSPPPPGPDVSNAAPPDTQAVNEAARPAPPLTGADVASPTSDETCKRDEDRLARLRSNPSGEEAQRIASGLRCEALRPQLQRLIESLAVAAPLPPELTNSSPASNSLLAEACGSERAALDRLRTEPSAEAAGRFWRDLRCESLRPQVSLLLESLNVAPEPRGSVAAAGAAGGRQGPTSDARASNGADPVVCRQETVELNRIRAAPHLIDAKRFAGAVTCDALKPQAARLLESLRE
jgi:hypothetical protein